jgi:hypothetical protein
MMIELNILKVTLQLVTALFQAHCLMVLIQAAVPGPLMLQKITVATAPTSRFSK